MTAIPLNGINAKQANHSDFELLLKEYQSRCYALKCQINEQILIKQSLIAFNKNNSKISQSLLRKKKEYENLKSYLCQTLFNIIITANKQKILCRKNLDEFLLKKKNLEEQYRKSPFILKLDELISANKSFQEECKKTTTLFESTKKQYEEMMRNLFRNFQKKVCEFCYIAVKFKALIN